MEEYRGMPFIDMIGVEMSDGSVRHHSKTVAIFSIEEEQARFYVQQKGTRKAYVRVVRDNKHYFPYLQTTLDHIKRNNLYSLPACTEKDGEPLPPWQESDDMEGGGAVDAGGET